MGVFVQRPYWASERYPPIALHATSVVFVEPTVEPLDTSNLTAAKLYARISGTALDTLLPTLIKSARMKVEQDTGLALLTQTRDVTFDGFPYDGMFTLPPQSTPLQSITSVQYYDTSGVLQTFDPVNYLLDSSSRPARIGLTDAGSWPTDLRGFQPVTLRIVAGYVDVAHIPAPLVQAVGVLVGFYANEGSDRFMADTMRDEYEELIAPYVPVTVA